MEIVQLYSSTVLTFGFMAILMLLQVAVVDVIGLKANHLPGSIVEADHSNLLFRASRVVANTNETVSIFVLATMFCVFSHVSPDSTSYAAWGYVVSRCLYALCYYFNKQLLRSFMFGLSLLALVALVVQGALKWF